MCSTGSLRLTRSPKALKDLFHAYRLRTLRKIFCTFVVTAMILASGFLAWQYWLYKGGIFRTSYFNKGIWTSLNKAGTSNSSCYRGGMAHDIKTNVLHVGLARANVEQLLGAPDIVKDETYEYFLGMCSGLRIDFDTLDVQFDSEGRVLKVEVVQH